MNPTWGYVSPTLDVTPSFRSLGLSFLCQNRALLLAMPLRGACSLVLSVHAAADSPDEWSVGALAGGGVSKDSVRKGGRPHHCHTAHSQPGPTARTHVAPVQCREMLPRQGQDGGIFLLTRSPAPLCPGIAAGCFHSPFSQDMPSKSVLCSKARVIPESSSVGAVLWGQPQA